ncbi:MAG TPA: penicillin-binding protein 1A [Pseudomonadales bacterium]|nr:penicillin-binding protein 1A [Pseudomonadales bacterium]
MKTLRVIALKLVWFFLFSLASAAMIASAAYLSLSPSLPDVKTFRDYKLQTPLRVYSEDGLLIGEFGEKKRTPLHYDEIPEGFIKALLAAEDDRFFEHRGINVKGLARAVIDIVTTGEKGSGGSTITMQVARAIFLTKERVFIRKFNEIILSLEMEIALTKEEILEMYINEVFLGHRAYGFEAAANVYYGKSLHELNNAQWAMLAGLPKAPSAYNPIVNPPRALIRRDWIIDRMYSLGYIDSNAYREAKAFEDNATKHDTPLDLHAPYAAEMARQVLLDMFGPEIYTDGFVAYTTLQGPLQAKADRAVKDGLYAYDQRHGYRGPEAVLPAPSPNDALPTTTEIGHFQPQDEETYAQAQAPLSADASDTYQALWLEALKQRRTLDGHVPAVVTAIDDLGADLLLSSGEFARLPWENGLADARPYIDENSRGPRPKRVADVVAVGHLIRVKQTDGDQWYLSQIPAAQAALISLDANSGAIKAVTGGFDFSQSKFNRVTQAARQPGSNLKPFIYAAALEHGFNAASIFNDAPVVFNDKALESTWRPENDSGKFAGPTRLREALYSSRNLVSIRLLQQLGIRNAIDYLNRFGFERDKLPPDLSLALGTMAVTPLQIAQAYATFANGGFKIDPFIIKRIESFDGGVLYQHSPMMACADCRQQGNLKRALSDEEMTAMALAMDIGIRKDSDEAPIQYAERIMDERVNFIMTDILSDTITKGTGRRARALKRSDIAGKTGTTNGPTDVWFSGFNESIVTTTWMGFDNNANLGSGEFGSNAALPMWIDFMAVALPETPDKRRKQPDGLVTIRIDPDTGKAASANQRNAIFEIFREENAPLPASESPNTTPQPDVEELAPAELF